MTAVRPPDNQTLQRTGRASRSSSFECASGARPAAERRSVSRMQMSADSRESLKTCDECGSPFFAAASEMEFYDLATDPGERKNLAADRPEIAKDLAASMRRVRDASPSAAQG